MAKCCVSPKQVYHSGQQNQIEPRFWSEQNCHLFSKELSIAVCFHSPFFLHFKLLGDKHIDKSFKTFKMTPRQKTRRETSLVGLWGSEEEGSRWKTWWKTFHSHSLNTHNRESQKQNPSYYFQIALLTYRSAKLAFIFIVANYLGRKIFGR